MTRYRLSSLVVCCATAALFLGSWRRHGPYTLAYGLIFAVALFVMLVAAFLFNQKQKRP